ncbi:hypothetical protein ACHAQH_004718 [Verticillium albo-atrum]
MRRFYTPIRAVHSLIRSDAIPPQRSQLRAFTTTRPLHRGHDGAGAQDHYVTLKVASNASPSEIKKSFYALSKAHHPDHNPNDPTATTKFHAISEAYATLGTPAKRAAYDRDHARHHHHFHGHSHGGAQPRGSYHSAGGRPASGLSRRRSAFRGPPPSFYRSGGWGTQSEKRKAAHDDSTGGTGATPDGSRPPPGGAGRPAEAGMGPGQDPYGHKMEAEVLHFDREGHTRTQSAQDSRRRTRMEGQGVMPNGSGDSAVGLFFAISGIFFMTFFLPYVFFGGLTQRRRQKKENKKAKTKAA